MLHCVLNPSEPRIAETHTPRIPIRVCAVSFLNTVPLVWGALRGPQQNAFDLSFAVPSVCADRLAAGDVDIGIVPCAELPRLGMEIVPDVGIACRGPVRSILLISKVNPCHIQTLAADASSRSSVMLTRIVLDRTYGVKPHIVTMPPDLESMLATADAALIIGDPALHLDPKNLPYRVLDLGEEWVKLSGLPMVFAVWTGRARFITDRVRQTFIDSCRYGMERIDEIAALAPATHGVPEELAREYLTRHIVFELGDRERQGLSRFLEWGAELNAAVDTLYSSVTL
jgi:chorismate dehydratase